MFIRSMIIALVLCASAAPAFAQATTAKSSTITAATPTPDDRARQWLVLVDDKNYAQSWSEAGKAFQNQQTADAWASDAAAKRESFGCRQSRPEISGPGTQQRRGGALHDRVRPQGVRGGNRHPGL